MMADGRDAYSGADFETALIRFTQGVQLLNWVKAERSEDQVRIDDLYLTFLRNQAQAALMLEKYQEAISEQQITGFLCQAYEAVAWAAGTSCVPHWMLDGLSPLVPSKSSYASQRDSVQRMIGKARPGLHLLAVVPVSRAPPNDHSAAHVTEWTDFTTTVPQTPGRPPRL